jgi:carboxymethylenebutenolidase
MCDERTLGETEEYLLRDGSALTRRHFGALVIGAGVAASLPATADALAVSDAMVEIKTADGVAETFLARPTEGKHPGVLLWPDAWGLRASIRQMARRLAESGYVVLAPNPYYRSTRLPALPEPLDMKDPEVRKRWGTMRALLTTDAINRDALTYLGSLDALPSVDTSRRLGTMGYCMGGAMALLAAAALPGRVGAAASFHGAGLVTDQPDSPHLLVARMKASALIAIAESDDKAQPEAKDTLREAFAAAGLPAEIAVYEGTLHGWCPPDTLVYNEVQAEKAWSRMLALFSSALAPAMPE